MFGEPEVCDLQVAVGVDQHVFGFEVAVDDVLAVQMFEDQGSLRCVVTCFYFVKTVDTSQVCE